MNFFQAEFTRVSTNQINWMIFTQLSKTITHFRDSGGRVRFLEQPVIPLIIVARQNYFYQNFRFKKTFSGVVTKRTFPFEISKLFPIYPPRGTERSSTFASTDSFLKNIDYIFLYFSIQSVFLVIFDRFHLFVTFSNQLLTKFQL